MNARRIHSLSRRAAVLALVFAATMFPVPSLSAGQSVEGALEEAQAAASDYDYAAALAALRRAAGDGNRAAQRSVGLMLLYGESLYGPAVPADRPQAIRWLRAAAANGCEVSAWVLGRLEVGDAAATSGAGAVPLAAAAESPAGAASR